MKKIYSIMMVLAMLSFTACSSDDEKNDNPLVGTWIVKSADHDCDIWFTQITLKSDGSGSIISDDEEIDDSN